MQVFGATPRPPTRTSTHSGRVGLHVLLLLTIRLLLVLRRVLPLRKALKSLVEKFDE